MGRASSLRTDSWGHFPRGRAQIQKCFECATPTTGRHHVVPATLGGTKVIPLCESCHSKVHGRRFNISALTKAGIAKAKAKGIKVGRRQEYTDEAIAWVRRRRKAGRSLQWLADKTGASKSMIHRWCKKEVQDGR